jgi:hypothetical protein
VLRRNSFEKTFTEQMAWFQWVSSNGETFLTNSRWKPLHNPKEYVSLPPLRTISTSETEGIWQERVKRRKEESFFRSSCRSKKDDYLCTPLWKKRRALQASNSRWLRKGSDEKKLQNIFHKHLLETKTWLLLQPRNTQRETQKRG